jgi:hypothetical protein
VFDDVEMTHHFVQAPAESIWHYVEAGKGEPVVLLYGIPDAWYFCGIIRSLRSPRRIVPSLWI